MHNCNLKFKVENCEVSKRKVIKMDTSRAAGIAAGTFIECS
jgi:hypothetical protein